MLSTAQAHPEGDGHPAATASDQTAADAAERDEARRGDGEASPGSPGGAGDGGAARQTPVALPAVPDAEPRAERLAGTPASKPRRFSSRLLDYSAHAAMIVGLIGFAWTVSRHVTTQTAPSVPAIAGPTHDEAAAPSRPQAVAGADGAELGALRRANESLAADVGALRAQLDALASLNSRVPGQVKGLQIGMDKLQSGLAAARGDAAAATAQINERLDRLAREREAALGRPDGAAADATTGSLPPAAAPGAPGLSDHPASTGSVPTPPARADIARAEPARPEGSRPEGTKPDGSRSDGSRSDGSRPDGSRADAARADDKPPVIASYVVRDVNGGVALIEGRRGMLEVVPGVSIPGAGVVKSIERRGRGWTVITTKGQLAYAAPLPTVRREGRRDYPVYRYDF